MNWKDEIKEKLTKLTYDFIGSDGGFSVFIRGKYVPYTRVQKRGFQTTKRGKAYFESNNIFWQNVKEELDIRGLSLPNKPFRLEDVEVFCYVESYLYGKTGGDTANYIKMVEDACQDYGPKGDKTMRLYSDDKIITDSLCRTFSVKSREEEGIYVCFAWKKNKRRVSVKKKKGDPEATERSFTFDIYRSDHKTGKPLIRDLYDSLAKDYGKVFYLNPQKADKNIKSATADVILENCADMEGQFIFAMKKSRFIKLPLKLNSYNKITTKSGEKIIRVTISW